MNSIFDSIYDSVKAITDLDWLAFLCTAISICAITILVTYLVTKALRKFLTRDNVPLPSTSIYINIARFTCIAIGITCILSSCFGVNVSGIIAALGVGGIAISLGFKDTINNLISGVQVASMKIMKPGDHVMVSNKTGTVKDITWRHTTIEDMYGQLIIVPNSIINTTAIIKKKPFKYVRVHVMLHAKNSSLSYVSKTISDEVYKKVSQFGAIDGLVNVEFTSVTDGGAKGAVRLKMRDDIDGAQATIIKDAIVRIAAPYVEAAKN